jgi:NAD+ synthase (glutamine-hydrolysing)
LVVKRKPPRGPLEKRILNLLMTSEFKRWQAPPILKVSDHAFGRGRRFPIAQHSLD